MKILKLKIFIGKTTGKIQKRINGWISHNRIKNSIEIEVNENVKLWIDKEGVFLISVCYTTKKLKKRR